MAFGLISSRQRVVLRAGSLLVLLAIAFWLLFSFVFPDGLEVLLTRWMEAQSEESEIFAYGIVGRVLHGFYSFAFYLFDTPTFGYLLGFGGDAANQLSWVELPRAAQEWGGYGGWAEEAWPRHIIELGPVLGVYFIAYRVGLAVWLGAKVAMASRSLGDPLPVLLFLYAGVVLGTSQITGHGTVTVYCWLFVGLCLALCRETTWSGANRMWLDRGR
jgi:hypothetical protein